MRNIVVLGGGESGFGSAVLAKVKGFDVFLSDRGTIDEEYLGRLKEWNIDYEQGGHTMERILAADLVIKSPGIPETAPVVKALRERGVRIISEIEFAGCFTKGRTICITGSNGKTTTTSLIYAILSGAGYDVAVGGNIGRSFAYTVATDDKEWYVLEISSFQLDGMYDFRADVSVLMNITPDHLDRYDHCFQNYIDSKMRIIRNQTDCDAFIFMGDDEVIAAQLPKYELPMTLLPFTVRHKLSAGAMLKDNGQFSVSAEGKCFEVDVDRLQIKGIHNTYNAMAAALAALEAGVEPQDILRSLYDFQGVEHRLEAAGRVDSVEWINDSKATNVDSVWYALESMTHPTVWIAGGTDKGNDYARLTDLARQKVRALVCMGVDNAKLIESFTGVVPEIYDTHSLQEAVSTARRVARAGWTVLLSPACASFDLFKNYEQRGELFKQAVAELQRQ